MRNPVASTPSINGPAEDSNLVHFWQIWNEHLSILQSLSQRWTKGDRDEAHELLHEALCRAVAVQERDPLQDKSNPRAWLVRVLYNCHIDLHRKSQRNPVTSIDPALLATYELLSREPNPEQIFGSEETFARIKAAIAALPESLQLVAEMRLFESASFRLIAECVGISEDNARQRFAKVRRLLSERIHANHPVRPARQLPDENHRFQPRQPDEELGPKIHDHTPSRYAFPIRVGEPGELVTEELVFATQRPIRLEQKIRACRQYIAAHPTGWKKYEELALLYEAQGNWKAAVEAASTALAKRSHRANLILSLGKWQARTSGAKVATATFERGKRLGRAWAAHFSARQLLLERDFEAAEATALKAIQAHPMHPRHKMLLAEIYLKTAQAGKVVAMLAQSPRLLPVDREEAHLLIAAWKAQDQLDQLAHHLPALQQRFPKDPLLLAEEIALDLLKGQLDGIAKKFRCLRQRIPGASLYFHLKLELLLQQGKMAPAERLLHEIEMEHGDCLSHRKLVHQVRQKLPSKAAKRIPLLPNYK